MKMSGYYGGMGATQNNDGMFNVLDCEWPEF